MSLLGGKKRNQSETEFDIRPKTNNNEKILRLGLTFVIILLVSLTILVIYIRGAISVGPIKQSAPINGPISGSFQLISKGALQYNNSRDIVTFAKVGYSLSNGANVSAILTTYTSNPIRKIYLLNTEGYCTECFIGATFYTALNSTLRQYGLILNRSSFTTIDINKIDAIPPEAIIIIPSGLIPNILLPNITYTNLCPKYTSSTILSLIAKGDILVYIGRNFSRTVTCSGQVVQTPEPSLQAVTSVFNVTKPAYNTSVNVTNPFFFTNSTFSFIQGQNFGSASATVSGQNGSMVVFSNYPSVGWNDNYSLLARDIAKALASRFWIHILANGTTTIPGKNYSTSTFTVFTTNQTLPNSPIVSSVINNSYSLVRILVKNPKYFAEYDVPVSIQLRSNGLVSAPSIVSLGGDTEISAQINNQSNKAITATVEMFNRSLSLQASQIIFFGQVGPLKEYRHWQFTVPSGYYFANLTDQNGAQYSTALIYVANASVTPTILDFKNATFSFNVQSNGQQVSNIPFSVNLNGGYNSSGLVQGGGLTYTLPKGTIVSYGDKVFNIKILNTNYTYIYSYANTGFNIPPLYIEVTVELIIVVLIAKFIVPPNIDEYYIDVPDIKPVQRQVLKENSDSIVDVFAKVNTYYHWRDMPLTVDEVKTGIGNYLKYGNAKVSITVRNTYTTLSKLIARGVLQEAGDYYAPTKWMQSSNHSIDYLVIYRKLRDFCVANAMLFTELDSTSNIDMIITNKSVQNFIKIYTEQMQVNDIELKQGARVFLAFIDEEQKLLFLDNLYMSYGRNAEIIKLGIGYGNLRLIDTNHLDDLKL